MVPDDDDPATPMVPCDAAGPMIPAPVIPVPVILGHGDPCSGYHLGMSLRILIIRVSSSEIQNGSLSMQENSTPVVGGFVSGTSVAFVL